MSQTCQTGRYAQTVAKWQITEQTIITLVCSMSLMPQIKGLINLSINRDLLYGHTEGHHQKCHKHVRHDILSRQWQSALLTFTNNCYLPRFI